VSDVNAWNAKIIEEFRANEGKLSGDFADKPFLLLHTTGAKTGTERVNPVAYLEDGDRMFVFASKAGADSNPDWYHNLVANPRVTVEVGTKTYDVTAKPLTGADRDRIYAIQGEHMPGFKEYQEKTSRIIPVVELIAD
jgi:deazaflavin-dependent oxidoreductase (nitroreductase family)